MKTRWYITAFCALVLALALGACGQSAQRSSDSAAQQAQDQDVAASESDASPANSERNAAQAAYRDPGDAYQLQQVVMLSRHNIRAPLSTNGSALAQATPHTWIEWSANPSELTLRGGLLETMMGQYVRTWLEDEGLAPQNWQPGEGQVRFYANAKQRTIATAQYFSSGMLPLANVTIETRAPYDTMDPVFTPAFTYLSDSYEDAALEQIAKMGGNDGMAGVAADLSDSFDLLSDVVDYTNSEGYKSGELAPLDTTDTQVTFALGEEPAMTGSLKTACSLADALVLQYFESDDAHAAFGQALDPQQWESISRIKDRYGDVLFTAPLVATNLAHPLLEEIASEMDTQGRVFTFLCGHDSNLSSVLAALGVEAYELPGTIEKTPIGSKLVFERWADADGKQCARVLLMYQSTEQLRNLTLLSDGEQPMAYELSFAGLSKNADGLYAYDDLRSHLQEAIDAYDALAEEYGESDLAEAA